MVKLKSQEKETSIQVEEEVPRNIARFGSSLFLKGELSGDEDIMIEGHFRGKIDLWNNNILIGQRGKVEADIRVKNITINGSVTGNIHSSGKVFISREGRMKGDIVAPVISIMDGAQFKGSIKMGESSETVSHPAKRPETLFPEEEGKGKKEKEREEKEDT